MRFLAITYAATALLAAACAPVGADDPTIIAPGNGGGQCRADQYQGYIGRHRSELPARPPGEIWRVTCTTCPVTMDYQPARLNILYEQNTGVIREIKCG